MIYSRWTKVHLVGSTPGEMYTWWEVHLERRTLGGKYTWGNVHLGDVHLEGCAPGGTYTWWDLHLEGCAPTPQLSLTQSPSHTLNIAVLCPGHYWFQIFREASSFEREPRLAHLLFIHSVGVSWVPGDWRACASLLGLLRVLALVCSGLFHCHRGHLGASSTFYLTEGAHSRTESWGSYPAHGPHFSAYACCVLVCAVIPIGPGHL